MKKDNIELKEVKTLIIIIVIIILASTGLYFITEATLNKHKSDEQVVVIDYSKTTIGQSFNLPKEEYYVLAYDHTSDNASIYETIYFDYEDVEDKITIYNVDLNLGFNNYAVSEESNTNPKDASEIKIKDVALMKFRDGKLIKYLETEQEIGAELS